MKTKISVWVAVGLIIAGLSSCNQANADQQKRFSELDSDLYITEDLETGCKYLIYADRNGKQGGVTPLLDLDGEPDCE